MTPNCAKMCIFFSNQLKQMKFRSIVKQVLKQSLGIQRRVWWQIRSQDDDDDDDVNVRLGQELKQKTMVALSNNGNGSMHTKLESIIPLPLLHFALRMIIEKVKVKTMSQNNY